MAAGGILLPGKRLRDNKTWRYGNSAHRASAHKQVSVLTHNKNGKKVKHVAIGGERHGGTLHCFGSINVAQIVV